VAATAGGVGFALMEDEAEQGLHPAQYPWSHNGWFSSYDHAAIRRGHQVYQQVGIFPPSPPPLSPLQGPLTSGSPHTHINLPFTCCDSILSLVPESGWKMHQTSGGGVLLPSPIFLR